MLVLPSLQGAKSSARTGSLSTASGITQQLQQELVLPSLGHFNPPAEPLSPPRRAAVNLSGPLGASSSYARPSLPSSADSCPPTPVPKDLLQGVRGFQDKGKFARCLEKDLAVRAVFSKGRRSSVPGSPVGEDATAPATFHTTDTAGSGAHKDDVKLLRAKDVARTKIRIKDTRLFDVIFHSALLNAYLDKAMKYIGCFLRHLEVEEWKCKRMGETKFLGSKVFDAADLASDTRKEKEKAMRELGMRYSLLLMRVAKERNTIIERDCFEAIYKLTNAVGRVYFPAKSKWQAIGNELDMLFRGVHFHRPTNFDPNDTWRSKSGSSVPKLSDLHSGAGVSGVSTSSANFTDYDSVELPDSAPVGLAVLESAESSKDTGGPKASNKSGEQKEAKHVGDANPLGAPDSPRVEKCPRVSWAKSPNGEYVAPPDQWQQHGEEPPGTWASHHSSVQAQLQGHHVHIYKSVHARSQFTEQILPSACEAARAISLTEQKRVLRARRNLFLSHSRSTSLPRGGVLRGCQLQFESSGI